MIRAIKKAIVKRQIKTTLLLLEEGFEGEALRYTVDKKFSPLEWFLILAINAEDNVAEKFLPTEFWKDQKVAKIEALAERILNRRAK